MLDQECCYLYLALEIIEVFWGKYMLNCYNEDFCNHLRAIYNNFQHHILNNWNTLKIIIYLYILIIFDINL